MLRTLWPVAVQRFEIQPRGALVTQLAWVNATANGRTIGRDVACDELTKEGPASCLIPKRRFVVNIHPAIAEPAGTSKRDQECIVG
jgi:hypothetical protein